MRDGHQTRGGGATTQRLTPAMVSLLERAEVGVVATADAHGECDSSLRTGPPGFVRVLDPHRVAYPEYRGNGVMASLGNIEENPHAGLMLIDFARGRSKLHLQGSATVVSDEDLRASHPDLPTESVPGRRTNLWVVLQVEDASLERGDDVPALVPVARASDWGTDDVGRKGGDYFGAAAMGRAPTAPEPTTADPVPAAEVPAADVPVARGSAPGASDVRDSPTAPPRTATPSAPASDRSDSSARSDSSDRSDERPPADSASGPARLAALVGWSRLPLVAAVLAVLVVLLAVGLVASLVGGSADTAAVPPAAPTSPAGPPGPTGPTTLYGRVVSVNDPGTVVVDVQGQSVLVDVLGIDGSTVPACARADALDFARTTLDRQMVTLVPDPTLAQTTPRQAYIVLDRQLSYTDAIIQAGWAAPSGPALYRPVFDEERRDAQRSRSGMYGPPCVR